MKNISNILLFALVTIFVQACVSSAPNNNPLSKDEQIILQLKDAGKNLSHPRNLEFFLYFPSENTANNAAKNLIGEGFKIEISKDDFKKMWLVLATTKILPSRSIMQNLRQKFESMTTQAGGKYLDWGTPMAE